MDLLVPGIGPSMISARSGGMTLLKLKMSSKDVHLGRGSQRISGSQASQNPAHDIPQDSGRLQLLGGIWPNDSRPPQ